jgi:5-enolpyruvylshikimate-3-phosphate synthase
VESTKQSTEHFAPKQEVVMNSSRTATRFGAALVVAGFAALTATSSLAAAPSYDGVWSVSITTIKGDCIASYRYPMRIEHGVVSNGGDVVVDVSGRVASTGLLKVVLSHGETHAVGQGRLVANTGAGSWKTESCSGSWTAERRG